ncbi:MAG: AIR synthase-related protein, partial [Planctomycetota bacterium]
QTNMRLLPSIADDGLATAAKDISQAGILGTAAMLAETSQVGIEIELERIPMPPRTDHARWMKAFPSFGYLLATDAEKAPELLERFTGQGLAASSIGTFNDSLQITTVSGADTNLFWDFTEKAMTGC